MAEHRNRNENPVVTIKGNVVGGKGGEALELRQFPDGTDFVNFRVAVSNGETRDGDKRDDIMWPVVATGALARNLADSLTSGEAPVIVTGRVQPKKAVIINEKNDEEYEGLTFEFRAFEVGVGLQFGTVDYTKVAGKGGGRSARNSDDDGDEKPARRSSRRSSKADDDEDEKPARRSSRRSSAKSEASSDDEGDADEKPTRRRRSRAVDADDEEAY